jgi:hypothetical protein
MKIVVEWSGSQRYQRSEPLDSKRNYWVVQAAEESVPTG